MRATLRHLISPEAPEGLDTFAPEDPEDFAILVQALVGPTDAEGEESFDFQVMSPQALAREAEADGYTFLRHRLVLNEWNFRVVTAAVEDLVARIEGEDWPEIAAKLSRFGRWEFEDYRPYPT